MLEGKSPESTIIQNPCEELSDSNPKRTELHAEKAGKSSPLSTSLSRNASTSASPDTTDVQVQTLSNEKQTRPALRDTSTAFSFEMTNSEVQTTSSAMEASKPAVKDMSTSLSVEVTNIEVQTLAKETRDIGTGGSIELLTPEDELPKADDACDSNIAEDGGSKLLVFVHPFFYPLAFFVAY